MVRRASLGAGLFSWERGEWVGGVERYIEAQDKHHAKSIASGSVH
ncbi:MAG: hypothetical protein Q8O41_06250 [Candidatus Methanoperedens sp.]|nr:hypothetical protein [Candidatus Methanoperedens sp.]